MAEEAKITKEMTINEVIQKYPKTAAVFTEYGFHCVGCPASQSETIREGAELHQIDLQKFLEDLNKICLPRLSGRQVTGRTAIQ